MTKRATKTLAPQPFDVRNSSSTKTVGRRQVIDLNNYIPGFLSAINNTLSRGASQLYRDQFGIGIVDWRVMSMLAIEPKIPAVRICSVISTDKGQVSRALVRLSNKQLVSSEIVSVDVRKKKWRLTQAGLSLHDRVLQIALLREENLIGSCDADDVEAFLRVARHMAQNVSQM